MNSPHSSTSTTTNVTSFILSINTDKLQLQPNQQQQFTTLTQNYVTTVATIQKKKDDMTMETNFNHGKNNHHIHNSSKHNHNRHCGENASTNDQQQQSMSNAMSSSMISPNQISSMWELCIEHHIWKEESILSHIGSSHDGTSYSNHTKSEIHRNVKYHATVLYAIIWTFEQGMEDDDNDHGYDKKSESGKYIEYEAEEIDYDAMEIVWKVL